MEDYLIELNQEWLLDGHFRRYKDTTIEYKKKKGTFINPNYQIALKDYGDFWNAFKFSIKGNEFILDSLDEKTEMLLAEYGENLFNIPEENKAEVSKRFTDILLAKIKNVLENA